MKTWLLAGPQWPNLGRLNRGVQKQIAAKVIRRFGQNESLVTIEENRIASYE